VTPCSAVIIKASDVHAASIFRVREKTGVEKRRSDKKKAGPVQ
jgi:hypothetical protein